MKILLSCLLSLCFSLCSFRALAAGETVRGSSRQQVVAAPAPAPWIFTAYVFTPEFRYERSSDLDLGYVSYIGYGLGLRHQNFAVLLETTRTTTSSGNQALSIDREHRDWLLTGRYFFWNRVFGSGTVGFFAAGGVGFYNETVRTTLTGNVTQDNGNREVEAIAGLGTEATFAPVLGDFGFTVGTEFRILASKNFDPNPVPVGLARFGVSF
jgi:hypothetical protein